MPEWENLAPAAPDLFGLLRAREGGEIHLRFRIGTGDGFQVEVPAASLALQGLLRVEPGVDRFAIEVPGWGPEDFAWFARRKGRGRPDYWQGAVEYRPHGHPALVLYFTAPLDGLEIAVRGG